MLAGYPHLLAAARRLQWDAEAIDLTLDRDAYAELDDAVRALLTTLVAGFRLAEHAVADELAPFVTAAGTPGAPGAEPAAAACFAAQAGDEARHARFFDRVAEEVLDLDPHAGHAAPIPPAIRALFSDELPAAARALAADVSSAGAAIGLYHLVLEGIVFAVGQEALLELALAHDLEGVADGVGRVQGDERWHVGLGVLSLQRLGAPIDVHATAGRAIAAWGPEIADAARTERVLAAHDRRVAIAAAGERAYSRASGGPTAAGASA